MSVASKELIIAALLRLEVDNESHWTKDGQPSMAAIEAFIPDHEVTRQNVTEAAPDFTRETRKAQLDADKAAAEAAELAALASTDVGLDSEMERYAKALIEKEEAETALNEMRVKLDRARAEYDSACLRFGRACDAAVIRKHARAVQASETRAWIDSQARLRQERAEAAAALPRDPRAPIDRRPSINVRPRQPMALNRG